MLSYISNEEVNKASYKASIGQVKPMINWKVISDILAHENVICIGGSYSLWIAEVTNNSDRKIQWMPNDIDVYTTNISAIGNFIARMGYFSCPPSDESYGEYPKVKTTRWKIFGHHDELHIGGDRSKTMKVDPQFMHEINVVESMVKSGYYGGHTPVSIMNTFDLTVCQASLVEVDGGIYLQTSSKFDEDFNRRKMRFCTPESWGSEMSGVKAEQRVIKYIQRGFSLEKEVWWGEQERLWLDRYVGMDNQQLVDEIGIVFEVA